MKRMLILIGLCFAATSYAVNGTEGHGGDPLHFLFEDARISAAARVRSAQECSFSVNVKTEVREWIMQHKEALADDINSSHHNWITDTQPTCAFTQTTSKSDITLSYNVCRAGVNDISDAIRVLVHESVHHFGIANEYFPDDVALAIYNLGMNSNCPIQPSADPFDPASCPGTHLIGDELRAMIPLPVSNEKKLGRFQVSIRSRTCYGDNWCTSWSQSQNSLKLRFGYDYGSKETFTAPEDGGVSVRLVDNSPVVVFASDTNFFSDDNPNSKTSGATWFMRSSLSASNVLLSTEPYGVYSPHLGSLEIEGQPVKAPISGWLTKTCLRQTTTVKSPAKDNYNNDIVKEYDWVVLSNFDN